jgi:nucleoside 2-deoxyribosyltransferase
MSYEEDRAFQQAISEGLVPKMKDSSFAVAICPTGGPHEVDAKFAVELGVMIMLDKPIIAVVAPNTPVPDKLRLVADELIVADIETDEGREEITQALIRVTGAQPADG